jgi:hypothetical protein
MAWVSRAKGMVCRVATKTGARITRFLLSSSELQFPGVQGGNKSRQIFPFTPKTPNFSVECSGSGHRVDGDIWLSQ